MLSNSPNAYEPADNNPNREPVFKISGTHPLGYQAFTFYQGKDEKDALECIKFFAGWSNCRVVEREESLNELALAVGAGA